MTRAQIARLKEQLAADYKRKVEALELVEQMLEQQQKSQSLTGHRDKVEPGKSPFSTNIAGTTITTRIEQAFKKQQKWTTTGLLKATRVKHRATLWKSLNKLVKAGKLQVVKQRGKLHASIYTRATV